MSKVTKNSVCHTPYLRNHTSYDFHLCIYSRTDISRNFFFFILSKFWYSRCLRGSKGEKLVKNSVCCTFYLRNHTSFDCHLWYTSVSSWYLQAFFPQYFDFSAKEQKMVQNEKRFCLLYSISQEPYIIWFSFVVDRCKMVSPEGFFFFFFFFFIFSKF